MRETRNRRKSKKKRKWEHVGVKTSYEQERERERKLTPKANHWTMGVVYESLNQTLEPTTWHIIRYAICNTTNDWTIEQLNDFRCWMPKKKTKKKTWAEQKRNEKKRGQTIFRNILNWSLARGSLEERMETGMRTRTESESESLIVFIIFLVFMFTI